MKATTGMVLMFMLGTACQSAPESRESAAAVSPAAAPLLERGAISLQFTDPIRHQWVTADQENVEVVFRFAYRCTPGHEATVANEIASNLTTVAVRSRSILERFDHRSAADVDACAAELQHDLEPMLLPVDDGVRDGWVEQVIWERRLFY